MEFLGCACFTGYSFCNFYEDFTKNGDFRVHPTQKPIALLDYLVRTFSNENDLVLDNCMGSGTTGIACKQLGRRFIGIELNEDYYNIATERITNV